MPFANEVDVTHPDELTLRRCNDMTKLIIRSGKSFTNPGAFALEQEVYVTQNGRANGFSITENVPGVLTLNEIAVCKSDVCSFAIRNDKPDSVYGYYHDINKVLIALEQIIWRYWIVEPMVHEIVTKLKRSGSGKLGIKTAEHMWSFVFSEAADNVEINADFALRKCLGVRWEANGLISHFHCAVPFKKGNILIYEMLRQQGLI